MVPVREDNVCLFKMIVLRHENEKVREKEEDQQYSTYPDLHPHPDLHLHPDLHPHPHPHPDLLHLHPTPRSTPRSTPLPSPHWRDFLR